MISLEQYTDCNWQALKKHWLRGLYMPSSPQVDLLYCLSCGSSTQSGSSVMPSSRKVMNNKNKYVFVSRPF